MNEIMNVLAMECVRLSRRRTQTESTRCRPDSAFELSQISAFLENMGGQSARFESTIIRPVD